MRTVLALPFVLGLAVATVGAQSLDELTAELAKAETIDDEAVGDGGEKSATRRLYERWRDAARTEQLRRFTQDASPAVRAYAAKALREIEAPVDWPVVVRERLLDTAEVVTFEGCCKARQFVGDVVFTLARPQLSPDELLDAAEDLVVRKSPLFAREWALRNLTFRDRMLHRLRELATNGDAPATIALARHRLPVDVPILAKALQAKEPFDDNCAFLAAEVHPDAALMAPLVAIEGKARARIESDNPSRLRFWFAAIAAQRSADAGAFLVRFLRDTPRTDGFREQDLLDTMQDVVVPHPGLAAFDALRAELKRRAHERR